jgi:hypothetical protein
MRASVAANGVEEPDLDADIYIRNVMADGGWHGIKHGTRISRT